MADDSSDSDPCCEWTLVSGDGQIIGEEDYLNSLRRDDELPYKGQHLELPQESEVEAVEKEIVDVKEDVPFLESEGTQNLEELFWRNPGSLKQKVEAETDDEAGHSDSSSDIEKLDELPALEVSYHSDLSKFSDLQPLVTDIKNMEEDSSPSPDNGSSSAEDQLDLSDSNSLRHELPDDLNIECIRSYRHTPNQQLNVTLNMLLALSITTVIGLGIGHFIGWSSQWIRQNHIQQSQILKLKMLQDELVTCLQRQHLAQPLSEGVIDFSYYKPCFEQAEYWRHQFNELLSENDDLRDMVMDKNQGSYCREVTEIGDEYQKMKLNLLHKQLDHIETLKQFELVKRDERESREQVKLLKDENHDLKTKLDTDGGDTAEDQRVMCHLMKENAKLRLTLNDLQPQIQEDVVGEPKDDIIQVEVGSLRQKINQLQLENEDLRQVIVRLRYGKPPAPPITDAHQNKLNQLETENKDLKVEIGKIRYGKPPEILTDVTDGEKQDSVVIDQVTKKEDSNVVVLQNEIKNLRNAFDVEKNQTLKWKELYEALTRDTPADDNFKAWIQDNVLSLDVSKFFEVLKSKGVHSREFLELLKQKNGEWLDKLWVNMSRATDTLLNKVQETRQQMEDYIESDRFQLKSGKKLVKKMSKVLSNTMHKFRDATENLIPENLKKSSAKVATKLVDKINGLVNHLNSKWSEITSDLDLVPTATTEEGTTHDFENEGNKEKTTLDVLDKREFENMKRKVPDSQTGNKIVVDENYTKEKQLEDPLNNSSSLQEPKNGKPKQNDYKHSRSSNDSIGKQGKFKSKSRWTRERRGLKRNARNGVPLDKHDAEWVFRRAQYREAKKLHQQQADWLFDRARNRAEQRQVKVGVYRDGKPQTDWFFERARDRERAARERHAKDAMLKDWWFGRAQDREEQRHQMEGSVTKPEGVIQYKDYDDSLESSDDFEDGILIEDDDEDLVYKTSSPAVQYRTQYYAAQRRNDDDDGDDSYEDDEADTPETRRIHQPDESRRSRSDDFNWDFNDELIKIPCDTKKNFAPVYRSDPHLTTSGSHDDRKTYKHPEKEMKRPKTKHSSFHSDFRMQAHHTQTIQEDSQLNCAKKTQKNFREKDCSRNRWKVEQNRQFYQRQNKDKFARSERQCCEYDSTNNWVQNNVDNGWDEANVFHRTVVSCNC